MSAMYQPSKEVLAFDKRLGDACREGIEVGDFLSGSHPKGASVRLPPSGDGGRNYDYARQGHPSGARAESIIAKLEMGKHALCYSDGMRAIRAVADVVVAPGETILAHTSLYGGSIRYLNRISDSEGQGGSKRVIFKDLSDPSIGSYILETKPKLIFFESVSNPLLQVLDMGALMRVAARAGSYMAIDNTLATPYACVPLDIARQNDYDKLFVVLSITKGYTAGALGGAVVTDMDDQAEKLFRDRQSNGGNASPNDVADYLKGLESMDVRMERLSQNTQALVSLFKDYEPSTPGLGVLYPDLIGQDLPKNNSAYLIRPPGVFTLNCRLPERRYSALIRRFDKELFRSNSFNGSYPQFSESTKQSHAGVKSAEQKKTAGISEQLIRVSPGSQYRPQTIVEKFQALVDGWKSAKRTRD